MVWTDPDSGIIFDTWSVTDTQSKGGLTIGFTFPEDALENDATELLGVLVCPSHVRRGTLTNVVDLRFPQW